MLSFTEVMADSGNLGHFTLGLHDMGRYMRLDAAAQRALNVMKSRSDANDAFSLYGLMNRCKTVMGKRLLKVSPLARFRSVQLSTQAYIFQVLPDESCMSHTMTLRSVRALSRDHNSGLAFVLDDINLLGITASQQDVCNLMSSCDEALQCLMLAERCVVLQIIGA